MEGQSSTHEPHHRGETGSHDAPYAEGAEVGAEPSFAEAERGERHTHECVVDNQVHQRVDAYDVLGHVEQVDAFPTAGSYRKCDGSSGPGSHSTYLVIGRKRTRLCGLAPTFPAAIWSSWNGQPYPQNARPAKSNEAKIAVHVNRLNYAARSAVPRVMSAGE